MTLTLKRVLWLTALAAVIIRVIYGIAFLSSELAEFNYLDGLDMSTHLKFANWHIIKPWSLPMFVMHRFLLFFCFIIAGNWHDPATIYTVQALFGVGGAVAAAWSVYLLSKNTKASLAAGLIYGFYGPFLLYESVALQESVLVHTLAMAFALLLYFLQTKRADAGILCGILLGMNSAGRPATALFALVLALYPFYEQRKEKLQLKRFAVLFALFGVWCAASLFNKYYKDTFSPFFNVMPHLVEVHTSAPAAPAVQTAVQTAETAAQNTSVLSGYFSVLWGAIKNVPLLFGMREIPENLDYDVIRGVLPILSLGPLLLMPFAAAGMIVMALLRKKELLLLYVSIAVLIVPLAARVPIGRYRLLLIPFFIIFAVLLISEMVSNQRRRLAMLGIVIGVIGCNLLCASPLVRPNPAAHHTLALAAVRRRTAAEQHLLNAWVSSNYSYKPSGLMLIVRYMKQQKYAEAEKVILESRVKSPEFLYYFALIRTAQNRMAEAEAALRGITSPHELGALYPKYLQLAAFIRQRR